MSQQLNEYLGVVQNALNNSIYGHVVKFSVLPLVLILSAFCGVNFWFKVEVILSFLFGIALMVPVTAKCFLEFQMKGNVDNYQLFLMSLFGCYLMYSAMFPVYLKKSRDESVFVSHFWSKIISSNLMIITMVFSYLDGLRWNYNLLCFSGGALLATLVINAFFLSNSTSIRAQNHQNLPANFVAKVEFFMLLSAGLTFFAFPDEAMLDLKNPHNGHRMLARCCGALLFSLSIESFTMPSFLFEKDKQKFLMARLVGSLMELVVILLGYFYFKVITSKLSLGIYMFVNMSYNALILYGYFTMLSKVRELRHRADEINASSANSSFNISYTEKKMS